MKLINNFVWLLLFFGATVYANIEQRCVKIDSAIEYEARYSMINDFHLDENDLDLTKTTLTLIAQQPISKLLTQELTQKATELNPKISLEAAKKIYTDNDLQRLMVQFSYFNQQGKENIIILSTVSKDQDYRCLIGPSDYLIVKREF